MHEEKSGAMNEVAMDMVVRLNFQNWNQRSKMTPKERTIHALKCELAGADDNLCRAKRAFDPARENMNAMYGQSGKTKQQILDQYENEYNEVKAALEWVESLS